MNAESQQYRQNAAAGYDLLNKYGTEDRDFFRNNWQTLSPQYNLVTGLQGGGLNPAQTLNVAGSPGQGQTAAPGATAGGAFQRDRPTTSGVQNTNTGNLSTQAGDEFSYGLTPAQQSQLNTQVDQVNRQMESALADYRSQLGQRGLPPNAAGEAQIKEHFAALASQQKATFAEGARQNKQNALQYLLSYIAPFSAQGAQETQAAAGGNANLAGGTQQQANELQGQASSAFGGLANLIGFALGGGFSGTGGGGQRQPTSTPPIANTPGITNGILPGGTGAQWLPMPGQSQGGNAYSDMFASLFGLPNYRP